MTLDRATVASMVETMRSWANDDIPVRHPAPLLVPARLHRRFVAWEAYDAAIREAREGGRIPLKLRLRTWKSIERKYGGDA